MRYNVNEEWEGPHQRVTDNAVNAGIDVFAFRGSVTAELLTNSVTMLVKRLLCDGFRKVSAIILRLGHSSCCFRLLS